MLFCCRLQRQRREKKERERPREQELAAKPKPWRLKPKKKRLKKKNDWWLLWMIYETMDLWHICYTYFVFCSNDSIVRFVNKVVLSYPVVFMTIYQEKNLLLKRERTGNGYSNEIKTALSVNWDFTETHI